MGRFYLGEDANRGRDISAGRGRWVHSIPPKQNAVAPRWWKSIMLQCRQAVKLFHDLHNVSKWSDEEEWRVYNNA